VKETFEIPQKFNLKEVIVISLSSLIKGKTFKKYVLYFFALVASTILLGGLAGPKAFTFQSIMATILPACLFAVLALVVYILIIVISHFFSQKLEIIMKFNHWGIIRNAGGKEASSPWRDAKNYKETDKYFLIYMKAGGVVPVQKDILLFEEEINEFRELLNDKISSL
jgi:hypothetical protein